MLTDVRALRVNRGDRVIEVKITVIKAKNFETWRADRLIQVRL